MSMPKEERYTAMFAFTIVIIGLVVIAGSFILFPVENYGGRVLIGMTIGFVLILGSLITLAGIAGKYR